MGWIVRLFLLLYLMPFWSESSSSLVRGLRTRFLIFYQDHMLLTRRLVGLMVLSLSSVPTIFCMFIIDLRTLILWWSSGYATIFVACLQSFEHLQPLCCLSHPRFLNSLKHLQNPFLPFRCPLGQINHTNRWVEVLCYLGVYVGDIIMTLGVLGII